MWCAADNHNYTCIRISDLNFNEAVIDKISILIFHDIAPNFTYKKRNFKSIIGDLKDHLLLLYTSYGRDGVSKKSTFSFLVVISR